MFKILKEIKKERDTPSHRGKPFRRKISPPTEREKKNFMVIGLTVKHGEKNFGRKINFDTVTYNFDTVT